MKTILFLQKAIFTAVLTLTFLVAQNTSAQTSVKSKNNNFSILKFDKIEKYAEINNFVDNEGYILITPTTYKSFFIDGFFGVKFIKND